jgi:rubrerythrin
MSIAAAAENGITRAGVAARGEFRCAECGYGVTVRRTLPACPMCRAESWQPWPSPAVVRHAARLSLV